MIDISKVVRDPRLAKTVNETNICFGVSDLQEINVLRRISSIDIHASVPLIRDHGKVWINRRAQAAQQWVFKVTILTLAEAVPRHVDMTAKVLFLGIERRNLAAFIGRKKSFDYRAALTAQVLRNSPSHTSQHGFYPLAQKMLGPASVGCSC